MSVGYLHKVDCGMKGRYVSSSLSEGSKVNRSVRRMVDEEEDGANMNRNRRYYFSVLFLICTGDL